MIEEEEEEEVEMGIGEEGGILVQDQDLVIMIEDKEEDAQRTVIVVLAHLLAVLNPKEDPLTPTLTKCHKKNPVTNPNPNPLDVKENLLDLKERCLNLTLVAQDAHPSPVTPVNVLNPPVSKNLCKVLDLRERDLISLHKGFLKKTSKKIGMNID